MPSRARKRGSSDEDGFIIIEVLVSALILAIVAGAVLTLIAATTRGAATQRDRAVAYDLAQEDQARLRTKRITTLNGLNETNEDRHEEIKINGTVYHVKSEGFFVNNNASGISCTATNDSADYITLTSTVTAGSLRTPVKIQSNVSPSNGSIDPTHGTLATQTENAAEEPLPGISVKLSNGAYSATTATEGCANFADLPAATYKVVFSSSTLINSKNASHEEEQTALVNAGRSPARAVSIWDLPATLEPEFVYLEPGTATLRPAPVDSMSIYNSLSGVPVTPYGTPGGSTRYPTTEIEPAAYPFKNTLYPFKESKYTVYAGSCASNNPDPEGKTTANDVGLASVEVLPGKTLKPRIYVPALEVTVTDSAGVALSGATVTLTDANANCKYSGAAIKRKYVTNLAGHLSNSASGSTEAGVPFGTYTVCASAKVGGKTLVSTTKEVHAENFTTTGNTLPIKLTTEGTACS
jgi:type II secretory pathway pseudopilin PulG